jgi:hypothetical protein
MAFTYPDKRHARPTMSTLKHILLVLMLLILSLWIANQVYHLQHKTDPSILANATNRWVASEKGD